MEQGFFRPETSTIPPGLTTTNNTYERWKPPARVPDLVAAWSDPAVLLVSKWHLVSIRSKLNFSDWSSFRATPYRDVTSDILLVGYLLSTRTATPMLALVFGSTTKRKHPYPLILNLVSGSRCVSCRHTYMVQSVAHTHTHRGVCPASSIFSSL